MNKLLEAEIMLNQGATIAVVSKKIGVSDHTYYRWRKEYGGMRVDQARRLKGVRAGELPFKETGSRSISR